MSVLARGWHLLGGNTLQHLSDTRHHALQAAEEDVGAVFQQVEHLVGVLLHLILDVHLAALQVPCANYISAACTPG